MLNAATGGLALLLRRGFGLASEPGVLLGSCLRARVRLGCGLIPKHQWGVRAAHLLGRWKVHWLTMHSLANWRVAACMYVTGCMPVHPITQQTASLQALQCCDPHYAICGSPAGPEPVLTLR